MTKPWVQLASGRAFDLLEPTAEQAAAILPDLVRSICRINRFNGHTKHATWSVGSHSLLVADLLEEWGATPQICRAGLLHDIGEAIYGDVTSPVIRAMRTLFEETIKKARLSPGHEEEVLFFGDPFTRLRARVDPVLAAALGLEGDAASKELVKRADLVAQALERRDLMAKCEREWNLPEFAPPGRKIYWSEYGLDAGQVERAFFERLERLNEAIEIAKQPSAPTESP